MRLIVTRPREEAERTAADLRARGHDILIAPMLRIEAVADVVIPQKDFAAVLVTSANAIRAIESHAGRRSLAGLPLFAVGGQTARAAREAEFADVVSADGDGGDLAALVAGRLGGSNGALLYLAGNDRARDLPGELAQHGLTVDTVVVYRAEPAASFPDDVNAALRSGTVDGALHYSRRTAEGFLRCAAHAGVEETIRRLTHYCLSPRVAEPFAAAGFGTIRIARSPDEAALFDVLGLS